ALHPSEGIPALERLARVRLEMGDRAASRAACEQLLMLDPRSATGILGLGLTGPTPMAQQAPEVRETSPTRRAGADRELGEAALFWQQSTPALTSLRRALDVWPDSPRLLLAVGQALIRAKDTEGAATLFARVAMANGRRPDALFGLAQAEMMRRNPQRALAIYRDLLRLDPNNFRALSEEAAALQLTGDDEQAAVLLTDLARRAPESVSINARLRESLFAIGRSYRSSAPEPAALRVVGASKDQATPAMPSPVEPVLGAGDAIRVRVVGRPEFGAEARVDVDGAIRLPFLKEALSARCLTERELSAQISRRVGAQLAGAAFEVSITELRRAPLVLAGAVHLPGSFNVRVALDLRESLMLASGATTRAGRSIFILRGTSGCDLQPTDKTAGQIETYERAAAEEGRIKLAQPVRPGDAVIVPERDAAFITGAVARPSIVSARENLTLLAAVRQLGGTLSEARRDNVRLLRLLPDGASRQQFIINLNEIEQHRVGDVKLLPGDIVEVPSNNGKGWASSFAALLQRSLLNTGSLAPTSPLRAVVTGASPAKQ
ncbi:MAG TPA: SLBB domain-containing protein, partial [Pyrinomonadaceae bacterium]|nr:SLBB domain-containing protein [Pyrinomonadaceae bacterium]